MAPGKRGEFLDLSSLIQLTVALVGAYLVVLWLGVAVWTFRDASSRTRDPLILTLAVALVLAFSIPGLVLYLITLRPKTTLAEAYERSLEEEALLRELDGREVCPSCRRAVDGDFIVCPNCATRLKDPCPQCGRALVATWVNCPYCAHRLEGRRPVGAGGTAATPDEA